MGSSRLPGKILLEVSNRPLLAYHLERLLATGFPVVVATTTQAQDQAVVDYLRPLKIDFYRGDESDVLKRFYETALLFPAETYVRVTSDCPLVAPEVIQEAMKKYQSLNDQSIYFSNCLERTYPQGFDFEIFSHQMLIEAHQKAVDPVEREHVTPYFYLGERPRYKCIHWKDSEDNSRFRLTVDEMKDYELIKILIEKYQAHKLNSQGIVRILKAHPELSSINQQVNQKKLETVTFRKAHVEDSLKLFQWRNDFEARQNSINTNEITWEEHQVWFEKILKNNNHDIWMGLSNQKEIGMLRVDRKDLEAELSWSIAPESRGQGLGLKMLLSFVKAYPRAYHARIKTSNISSLKIAQKAGFFVHKEVDGLVLLRNG